MGSVAPYAVSFFLRLIYGVTNILTKIAFSQGTSACVLVFYRFLIASVLLLPLAVAFERYPNLWLICLDVIYGRMC